VILRIRSKLVTMALTLVALPLFGDEPAEGRSDPQALFSSLDANKDGQLSADEVPADKKGLFERLVRLADKSGDGKLSSEEFASGLSGASPDAAKPGSPNSAEQPGPAAKRRDAERIFRRLDANSDGTLTLNEVPEERRRMVVQVLKRLKKDNDAGLSRDEFVRVLEARGAEGERPGMPPRPGQLPPGGPPRGGLFLLLDADHDGKLSAAEMSAAGEILKKLDRDGDGYVTIEELLAAGPRRDADR
jgi:Ca2+-binding EF-hand superfamily protein